MKDSYFGEFGGCFVPELLMPPLMEVEAAMRDIYPTEKFQAELKDLLFNYAGRETPLTYCPTLSGELGFDLGRGVALRAVQCGFDPASPLLR